PLFGINRESGVELIRVAQVILVILALYGQNDFLHSLGNEFVQRIACCNGIIPEFFPVWIGWVCFVWCGPSLFYLVCKPFGIFKRCSRGIIGQQVPNQSIACASK